MTINSVEEIMDIIHANQIVKYVIGSGNYHQINVDEYDTVITDIYSGSFIEKLSDTVKHLVNISGDRFHIKVSDVSTCINVSDELGSFKCTTCNESILENLRQCLKFIAFNNRTHPH